MNKPRDAKELLRLADVVARTPFDRAAAEALEAQLTKCSNRRTCDSTLAPEDWIVVYNLCQHALDFHTSWVTWQARTTRPINTKVFRRRAR